MVDIVFFEKPGCSGNARQKGLLIAAGHRLEVRDLLAWPWTTEALRPFFTQRPIVEWFNPMAPRVRAGDIDPSRLSEAQAMDALLASPLLIRRPLMQVGDERRCGFDPVEVDRWIGLTTGGAALSRSEAEDCPKGPGAPPCPPPRA
jgi:nitrogenase-associated protein